MSKLIHSAAETKKRLREADDESHPQKAKVLKAKGVGASTQKAKATAKNGRSTSFKDNQKPKLVGKDTTASAVIYLGHIPRGFFEGEMKKFFAQFGELKRVKLFRSAKTGNSKGYAFIEFASSEVASVVAEAMNGYFLQERQLISHVVPISKLHDGMFMYPKKKTKDKTAATHDKEDDDVVSNTQVDVKKIVAQQKKKMSKLKEMGIIFDVFDSLVSGEEVAK